jgi:hypothetical protein
VWIQPAIKSQWQWLDKENPPRWALSKRVTSGDLLLMYRGVPAKCITDIFVLSSGLTKGKAAWRKGHCYYGTIKRVCKLDSPLFLDDFRNHKVLKTSSFMRRNMQGNQLVSEYWHYLYDMIINRNPSLKKALAKYAPDRL